MKIHHLFMTLLIAGVAFTSCSDWLDYTPKDNLSYEQQFSTKAGFYNAMNGTYEILASGSLYGDNLSYGALDIMGQCYYASESATSNYELQRCTWTGTYASSIISSIWSSAYNAILNANMILEAAENDNGIVLNNIEHKMIKGEMLGLRAFLHFDLLRLFGPIYSRKPEGLSIPYNDSSDVLKRDRLPADKLISEKLIPDLKLAQELLAEVDPVITEGTLNSEAETGGNQMRYRQLRMNYYAVTLLKARVHLWAGDYDNALAEAVKIADDATVKQHFPFVDSSKLLANNTNPDRIFSTECLFGYYKKDLKNIYQYIFNGALNTTSVLQPRMGYVTNLFPDGSDYRRQSQWTNTASNMGFSDSDFIKYKGFEANKNTPEFWATFYGLMRISEAYYIAAECCINLFPNDLSKACDYLNVILDARGVTTLDGTKIRSDVLLKHVKMEYLRELRGEGQIFFLLKRFNQKFTMLYPGGDSDFDGAVGTFFADAYTVDEARYVIPIPVNEMN